MYFTEAEFDIMIKELSMTPQVYDMLCYIAEKSLKNMVEFWCRYEKLIGRECEEDIMQKIHLRLMQTVVTKFLYQDGPNGPCNDDPDGFNKWMFTVAHNVKCDFVKEVRDYDFKHVDIDKTTIVQNLDDPYAEERIEKLQKAFSIVLSSDLSIYKVLTWLAQFVFIYGYDVTKIKSNHLIFEQFSECSLDRMYEMILDASETIPWIVISEEDESRIQKALLRKKDGHTPFGQIKYKDFYMKYKGEKNGLKSISDWTHRMNEKIQKETELDENNK